MADAPAFPVHSLQVEALQREQNRIDARRARNAERAKRFNSGKRRNVSVETLARQIAHNDSRRDESGNWTSATRSWPSVSLIVEERRQADESSASELRPGQDWDWRSHYEERPACCVRFGIGTGMPRPVPLWEKILLHRGKLGSTRRCDLVFGADGAEGGPQERREGGGRNARAWERHVSQQRARSKRPKNARRPRSN